MVLNLDQCAYTKNVDVAPFLDSVITAVFRSCDNVSQTARLIPGVPPVPRPVSDPEGSGQ